MKKTVQEEFKQRAFSCAAAGNYYSAISILGKACLPDKVYVSHLKRWAKAAAKKHMYDDAIHLAKMAFDERLVAIILQMEA